MTSTCITVHGLHGGLSMLSGAKVDKRVILDLLHSLHGGVYRECLFDLSLRCTQHEVTHVKNFDLWRTENKKGRE